MVLESLLDMFHRNRAGQLSPCDRPPAPHFIQEKTQAYSCPWKCGLLGSPAMNLRASRVTQVQTSAQKTTKEAPCYRSGGEGNNREMFPRKGEELTGFSMVSKTKSQIRGTNRFLSKAICTGSLPSCRTSPDTQTSVQSMRKADFHWIRENDSSHQRGRREGLLWVAPCSRQAPLCTPGPETGWCGRGRGPRARAGLGGPSSPLKAGEAQKTAEPRLCRLLCPRSVRDACGSQTPELLGGCHPGWLWAV